MSPLPFGTFLRRSLNNIPRPTSLPSNVGLLDRVKYKIAITLERWSMQYAVSQRPKKIILVRHGQSIGNIDQDCYRSIPDAEIILTERGHRQAESAGKTIRDSLEQDEKRLIWMFYSPYKRAQQTAAHIIGQFNSEETAVICTQSPRLREQDFGNLQTPDIVRHKAERLEFGRFWYRFPDGESGSDAYDRVTGFLQTILRHMETSIVIRGTPRADTYIIVTHGLSMRLFCMRKFHWSVEDFHEVWNPKNCEIWTLKRDLEDPAGRYHLETDVHYGGSQQNPGFLPKHLKSDRLYWEADPDASYDELLRTLEHNTGPDVARDRRSRAEERIIPLLNQVKRASSQGKSGDARRPFFRHQSDLPEK